MGKACLAIFWPTPDEWTGKVEIKTRQWAKHAWLYSDPLQALKGEHLKREPKLWEGREQRGERKRKPRERAWKESEEKGEKRSNRGSEMFFYSCQHCVFQKSDKEPLPWEGRVFHTAVGTDTEMITIGGLMDDGSYAMDLLVYRYHCNTWHRIQFARELPKWRGWHWTNWLTAGWLNVWLALFLVIGRLAGWLLVYWVTDCLTAGALAVAGWPLVYWMTIQVVLGGWLTAGCLLTDWLIN